MSDGGKGSSPRPFSVDRKTFDDNWDRIFRKDPKEIDDAKAEDEAFANIEKKNPLEKLKEEGFDGGVVPGNDDPVHQGEKNIGFEIKKTWEF